ncbi:MAG: hypothetical protein AABZ53_16370 [Planctomycetota bacterium]
MGSTHRFLALGSDLQQVYAWFAALPEPPAVIQAQGGQWLHFLTLGRLQVMPDTGRIDPQQSPVASLFPPEHLRGILWTAGELHFLPTPQRKLFPKLDAISRRFKKWLQGFECVFETPGARGEWDFFLEGRLRNQDSPIFALPDAMRALRAGQYFVSHGMREDPLSRLCRTLELRGVSHSIPAHPFLFTFGFESPSEHASNKRSGSDFESSWAFWIEAASDTAALRWGCQVAEEFARRLFERAGKAGYSWAKGQFAHGLTDKPADLADARACTDIPAVLDGQMPDFLWALEYWST